MSGFTKLFTSITSSSIWNEDDKTRIVWITMLAIAEADGVVRASIGGLAHVARVTREDCEKALQILQSPDPDSRSPEHEGRRIQKVDGGFFLLNYGKYREARSEDERKAYMREYMRKYRKQTVNKGKQKLTKVSHSKPPLAKAEGEKEAKAEGEGDEGAALIPSLEEFCDYFFPAMVDLGDPVPLAEWLMEYHGYYAGNVWKNKPPSNWKGLAGKLIGQYRSRHAEVSAKKGNGKTDRYAL